MYDSETDQDAERERCPSVQGRGMVRTQELLAREPRVRATRRSPRRRRRLHGYRRSRLLAGAGGTSDSTGTGADTASSGRTRGAFSSGASASSSSDSGAELGLAGDGLYSSSPRQQQRVLGISGRLRARSLRRGVLRRLLRRRRVSTPKSPAPSLEVELEVGEVEPQRETNRRPATWSRSFASTSQVGYGSAPCPQSLRTRPIPTLFPSENK
ncbi:hypothetical protein B0H13DRAFT_2447484 [Mycena leptocephala]|nr:hypothetical protein B0H13DRAFT_2447484 [Mycena leptocephala]